MTLEEYATAFTKLRVNTARSSSPHKPCMLLAVLDLAEAGALEKNEIRYLPNLLERYEAYFDIVRTESRSRKSLPALLPSARRRILASDSNQRTRVATGIDAHRPQPYGHSGERRPR